jgi:hypothetical protein
MGSGAEVGLVLLSWGVGGRMRVDLLRVGREGRNGVSRGWRNNLEEVGWKNVSARYLKSRNEPLTPIILHDCWTVCIHTTKRHLPWSTHIITSFKPHALANILYTEK